MNLARKVFGFDSIEVAEAYKSLSKAFTINKIFKEGLFYEYAFKAFKIASTFYEPHSPKLIPYQLNFGSSLFLENKSLIFFFKTNQQIF